MMYVQTLQNQMGIGAGGASLPSDRHAEFIRVDSSAGNHNLVCVSGFAVRNVTDLRPTAVGEIKNRWLLSPQQIDQVTDGECHERMSHK
jgi:hypothetical protein